LLLLEHPPVYTRGRRSLPGELPLGEDWYRAQGIDVVDVDRGGRLTYHGPGQLVGYPIMKIDDVIAYLRTIERAIVATLADADLDAHARPDDGPDYTGVWIAERKIASIGVHVSRGVTTHGFAINVDNDLEPFDWVVACGLAGVSMTSVLEQAGRTDAIREGIADRFAEAFERRTTHVALADLRASLPAHDAGQLR
jgi:lipoyl(octanoyl) transferase